MSFIDDSEKNIERLMKEVSAGSVGGFVGRGGKEIDQLFAGAFHPDSGHGGQNEKLLAKQVSDRKKQRAEMEKQAAKDGVELVGVPPPAGGYFADIGETEGIELAYDELTRYDEIHRDFNEQMTPPQDLEWVEVETDLEYDEPGEAYKIKDIVYDDEPIYAGVNFINQSETNWKIIDRG
jgi:hypothetical protein